MAAPYECDDPTCECHALSIIPPHTPEALPIDAVEAERLTSNAAWWAEQYDAGVLPPKTSAPPRITLVLSSCAT